VRDLLDPPGGRAQHEGFARPAFEDHFLVQLADAGRAGSGADEEHAVQAAVGDGPAVDDRHSLRVLASADGAGDTVPGDAGSQLGELVRGITPRQHVQHAFVDASAQLRKRRRAPDGGEQLIGVPRVHRRHRDDLLRDDVQRVAWVAGRLDIAVVHRPCHGGAGDEVAAELRKDHALADGVDLMAAPADPLKPARDRRRRLDLHDEIDGAHIDAELERGRGDERAKRSALEQVLDLDALLARDRPVVRPDEGLARELVQRAGQALGQPPAVHEDQGRPVRANQFQQTGVDRRPDGWPGVAD
jgi:hypothetical protein